MLVGSLRNSLGLPPSGDSGGLTEVGLKDLQRKVCSNTDVISPAIRGLAWRVFLGVLPYNKPMTTWRAELEKQSSDYARMKEDTMPSLVKVQADPLCGLSDGKNEDEWTAYYKNIELSNFINGDLDRLYMSGVDDEYFQTPFRRALLLSVLLLWALRHKRTSYRQGMHEIAAPILYVLEIELAAFAAASAEEQQLFGLSEASLEAHTFVLLERIMDDLETLYDPTPSPTSPDKQPEIVAFCSKIQEQQLRRIDPQLCVHLEASYVQAQLYGMRWSRLMFGREFPLSHSQSLRVWDFLFASCLEFVSSEAAGSGGSGSGTGSGSGGVGGAGGGYTPLLNAIGDFILSMLLFVRDDLICDDSNVTIGILMHYPTVETVASIIEVSSMVKSGAIAAALGKIKEGTASTSFSAAGVQAGCMQGGGHRKRGSKSGSPPAWLRFLQDGDDKDDKQPPLPITPTGGRSSLGQHMTDGIGRLGSTMGEGISQLGGAVGSVLGSTGIFGASPAAAYASPFDPTSSVGREKGNLMWKVPEHTDPFGNPIPIPSIPQPSPISTAALVTPTRVPMPVMPAEDVPPARPVVAHSMASAPNSIIPPAPGPTPIPAKPAPTPAPPPTSTPTAAPATPQSQPKCDHAGVSERLDRLSEWLVKTPGFMEETDKRLEAAKRVRILSNVLAGLADLAEYDAALARNSISST